VEFLIIDDPTAPSPTFALHKTMWSGPTEAHFEAKSSAVITAPASHGDGPSDDKYPTAASSLPVEDFQAEESGRLDLLSPPPPPRLRLPNCPVCLRRIKSCVSGVVGSDELIVGPDFSGNGDRCPVCLVSSEEGLSVRQK
jgi:hypothetical protein